MRSGPSTSVQTQYHCGCSEGALDANELLDQRILHYKTRNENQIWQIDTQMRKCCWKCGLR